jgi:hypothetical protein
MMTMMLLPPAHKTLRTLLLLRGCAKLTFIIHKVHLNKISKNRSVSEKDLSSKSLENRKIKIVDKLTI